MKELQRDVNFAYYRNYRNSGNPKMEEAFLPPLEFLKVHLPQVAVASVDLGQLRDLWTFRLSPKDWKRRYALVRNTTL